MNERATLTLCAGLLLLTSVPVSMASDTAVTQAAETEIETADGPVKVLVNLNELNDANTQHERRHQTGSSQKALIDHVESTEGARVVNEFWITNSVLVEIEPRYDYQRLTNIDGVRSIQKNTRIEALNSTSATENMPSMSAKSERRITTTSTGTTYGMEQINATNAWSTYDTKGSGVRVAVLDSGVNVSHPDIELRTTDPSDPTYPGGWAEFDSDGNEVIGSEPKDTGTHGTHVTGTVGGEHTGVAPNVSLMHALIVNGESGTYAQVLGGMEWAVDNGADVVTMSIGGPTDARLVDAVENANQMGTTVVAAIGNNGDGSSTTPGNIYDTIGVGAVDSNLNVTSFSGGETIDTTSTWGTSAPSDWPSEYTVPYVVAAGKFVNSTSSEGGYELQSGTSMATPHVAGATALALSAAGDRSPERVTEAFALTAFGSGSEKPGTRYGHGAVDAVSVTEHLLDDASISGTIVNGSGNSIEDAEVTVDGLRVDSTGGNYEVNLTQGSWTLEVFASGYRDTSKTVTLEEDEKLNKDIELNETSPANFEVRIDSTTSPVTEGDTLSVDVTVENTGEGSDTQTVSLDVGGVQRDAATVTVSAGGTATKTLTWDTGSGDAGSYTATVETEDDSDTSSVSVQSPNIPPTASFTYSPSSPAASDTIMFNASDSSDSDGSVVQYEWDFGDGTTDTKTSDTVPHSYNSSGDYDVTLTVIDDDGAKNTTTQTVSVSSTTSNLTASFIYSPDNPNTSETVRFNSSGTSYSDGPITEYSWNFGDSTTASGETASHSYSSSGDYTVTLTVTDSKGATDTASQTVSVSDESDSPGGGQSPNNPFLGSNNDPADRDEVVDDIGNWLISQEIDGTEYTRDEVVAFIGDWLAA